MRAVIRVGDVLRVVVVVAWFAVSGGGCGRLSHLVVAFFGLMRGRVVGLMHDLQWHSCVVLSGGAVSCWGANGIGQVMRARWIARVRVRGATLWI